MKLSLVIPCFNEEEVLALFMQETSAVIERMKNTYGITYEYIFVDDGSRDSTLGQLRRMHENDPAVRYISFSRNFGKEAALLAGLRKAEGDYIAVMDADLQDPPAMLEEMYKILQTGEYDCVGTRRTDRKGEPFFRSLCARLFYRTARSAGDPELAQGTRDFRMMTSQVKDAIISIGEYNRFSKGIFSWVGFRTKWLEYENVSRAAGTTKWSFGKLAHYGVDGLVSYTVRPLEAAAWIGFFFFLLSMIGIVFIIVRKLLFGDPVAGWPSLVCIILFCSGVQLFCTGIIGEYLAKVYLEVKNRPVYIIRETDETFRKQ